MKRNTSRNGIERRKSVDRRKRRISTWRMRLFNGDRESIRRDADRQRFLLLDRYSATLFIMIVSILFLSLTDAFLTLILIDHGATEFNPIMAYFLAFGPLVFLGVKYLLTSFSVFLIVLFSQGFIMKNTIRVSKVLTYICGLFSSINVWELFLYYRYVH